MKNYSLAFLFFIFFSGVHAQQNTFNEEQFPRDIAQNELSANVFNVLIFGALDVTYERILTDHSSLSVDIFTKLTNKNEGEDFDLSEAYAKDFSLTTKFKFFFKEENTAWGFYAEAFGMISSGENEKEVKKTSPSGEIFYEDEFLDYTDLALGVGVGHKYVAKQGFMIDLSFGVGRNLFHKDSPDIVILPAINVGYRF